MGVLLSDGFLQGIEQGILGLLMALGAASILVFLLRWKAVGKVRTEAGTWCIRLQKDLAGENPGPQGIQAAKEPEEAQEAEDEKGAADRMARAGLNNAHLCPEALEKILETQEARERDLLERGASFLGTVGANAPFLGLTGTVLGILAAFRRMGESGGSGGVEVMSSIAGALVATAAGLIVAIPAVVFYNLLKAHIRRSLGSLKEIRALLLARSLQATVKEAF
jgi:biopolymer transport protein ExbB/TolQ